MQGRDVYLFPDLSESGKAFELWCKKAKELSDLMPGTRFQVSDLLETLAPNELKEQGADIADVLIKMDWQKFRPQQIEPVQEAEQPAPEPPPTPKSEKGEKSEVPKQTYFLHAEETSNSEDITIESESPKPERWEIKDLERYFETATLPTVPVKLNSYTKITDVSLFVHAHLAVIQANNGNKTFLPYLERLKELKQYLHNA